MKNFLIFLTLMFTSLSAQAQFSQALGAPNLDFRVTQIRTFNSATFVSGWLNDPNATTPALSSEGMIIRLDATGNIDWIYQLSSDNQLGNSVGTRIYDFDFDDGVDHIVYVGATTDNNNGIINNQSIIGMLELGSGVDVFQESYDFRTTAREFFRKISNDPGVPDHYVVSGLINEVGPGPIDNYVNGRAMITTAGVAFSWIQENDYGGDEELPAMQILDVSGTPEVVNVGTSLPGPVPRINFHNLQTGLINTELEYNFNGRVMDVTQIGNTMIAVGRNNAAGAFISSVDLTTSTVMSSLTFNTVNNFSRVIVEPISGDILAIGERNGANSAICRFDLNGNQQLNYSNATVLDFGNNDQGVGLLETDGNEVFFADTRNSLASFGLNQTAAVIRTDLAFNSCDTEVLNLTPQQATFTLSMPNMLLTTVLLPVQNRVNLLLENDTLCSVSMCANGFNLDTIITVSHGSTSQYVNVADIDNDGWQDFAVPDFGFGGTPRFSLSKNNQNLTFTNTPSTAINPLFDNNAKSMEFINLDNLGDLDIVVHRFGSLEVFIENSGNCAYSHVQTIDVTTASPPNQANIIGIYRSDFDLVDYNGDGDMDLVITGASNGGGQEDRIAIFEGTGISASPFNPIPLITMKGLPAISYWETVHVDLDGNLGNDLLIGQSDFNQAGQSIFGYLHSGNNNAPFTTNIDLIYETPTGLFWPRGMDAIDIDNNSDPDLIVAMQTNSLPINLTGEGAIIIARDIPTTAGTYTPANLQWETINIPGQPSGIEVHDMDGDGFRDIVVSVYNGTTIPSFVRIYENDGTGNFLNFTDIVTPIGQAVELQIGDFNNDCCPDIVTTQRFGGLSYVLINDCQTTEFLVQGRVSCENDPCNFLFPNNGVPNQLVEITDGTNTFFGITDAGGNYNINVPLGTYTIGVVNATYGDPGCLNANTADVTGFVPTPTSPNENFFIRDTCILDVNMVAGLHGFVGSNTCPFFATPCEGLIWEYCFEIQNNTCNTQIVDNITIDLPNGINTSTVVIGPLVECVAQTPVSTTVPTIGAFTGPPPFIFSSTIDYNINSSLTIQPGECFSACVEATFIGNFTLPVTAQVNVDYNCSNGPGIPQTSGVAYQDTCSCDPNQKLAYFPQNCGTLDELLDQPIEYTIQFTNIGQTAAYDIRILDQLDSNLDWSTFQWLGSSHSTNSINLNNGLLDVYFNNINLPPGGTGWINFSVKPHGTTINNTTISNYADIIFDNNAPVSTNTTQTTIQASSASADLQFNATEFCVGDKIVIDYTWTGTSAELNFTQNGTSVGQNIPAPPSGSQIIFIIPDTSYVGLWEYELVAYDSITGCVDTAMVTLQIYNCDCELDDEIFMNVVQGGYEFDSNIFDTSLNPGYDIIKVQWDLGDGTISTDLNPVHQYNCKKLGPHTVEVCLYYVAEINGQICEGEVCQTFEVCQKDFAKKANIYPNPASDQIIIQSEAFLNQAGRLTVETYTIEGKLLQTYATESQGDRIDLKLDNDYKGFVFLRILNHQGEILVEDRFIKIRDRKD